MAFTGGHTGMLATAEIALMSAVFAMQCSSEADRAVMSEHLAQGSLFRPTYEIRQ